MRNEALAAPAHVRLVDLPSRSLFSELKDEFEDSSDLSTRLMHRLTAQWHRLQGWWNSIKAAPVDRATRPTADAFGFEKLLIILTRFGKLLGLESSSGRLLWQRDFFEDRADLTFSATESALYLLKTAASYPAEMVLASEHNVRRSGSMTP